MRILPALTIIMAVALPTTGHAATIALINSPTGNQTFVNNFQAFIEGRGDIFVRNPTSFDGVDTVVNIRTPISPELAAFVIGGGGLLTEYSGINFAGQAGLINYRDSGGGNAGSGTPVTFTTDGIASGLSDGLSNPFRDGGATEFFRNGIVIGSDVNTFATRGAGIPAIVGARSGNGYVLGLAFDWGDGFITNTAPTRTLVGNGLDFVSAQTAVPEPGTWAMMLLGFGFVGGAMRSARRRQKVTVSYA